MVGICRHWSVAGPSFPQARLFDSKSWPDLMRGDSHAFFFPFGCGFRGVFFAKVGLPFVPRTVGGVSYRRM
jgi:hypothetical protein